MGLMAAVIYLMGAASSLDAPLAWIQAQRGMLYWNRTPTVTAMFHHVKTYPGIGNKFVLMLLKLFERVLHEQTDVPLCPAHGLWGAYSMHFSECIGEKSLPKSMDTPHMMKTFLCANDALFELIGDALVHGIEPETDCGGCFVHRGVCSLGFRDLARVFELRVD
jgi:hypothetical protein